MFEWFQGGLHVFEWIVFGYFIGLNTIYLCLLAIAAVAIVDYTKELFVTEGVTVPAPFAKPFSILVPAYNEAVSIEDSVLALLALDYPEFEVVVCNDGSSDETLEVLQSSFDLVKVDVELPARYPCAPVRGIYFSRRYPGLSVIDKEQGGKADALNAAASLARYPYVCAVDADSVLSSDSVHRLMQRFVADPRIGAIGGVVRVANGAIIDGGRVTRLNVPGSLLERIQVVEYYRAFLFGRMGWARLNLLMIISGAFGVYRQDLLAAVHGWKRQAVGEDMELVVRLHRYLAETKSRLRIAFAPDPVCWTQAPRTFTQLGRQRERWQRGLAQCLVWHRRMFLNPRYGVAGLVGYPYFLVFELLGAVVEFLGYPVVITTFILGLLNLRSMLFFLLVALVWGLCISYTALALSENSFQRYSRPGSLRRLMAAGFWENFGYRQIHSWWRVKGLVRYLFGGHTEWGHLEREGFDHGKAGGAS